MVLVAPVHTVLASSAKTWPGDKLSVVQKENNQGRKAQEGSFVGSGE